MKVSVRGMRPFPAEWRYQAGGLNGEERAACHAVRHRVVSNFTAQLQLDCA